jgi:hypothetical protein
MGPAPARRRTEQLGDDTLDGSAPEDGKGVAAVRGDDAVLAVDGRAHADRDGLLADGEVAEAPDELGLVEHVAGLLHLAHRRHLRVHVNQEVLGDLDRRRRRVAAVRVEPSERERSGCRTTISNASKQLECERARARVSSALRPEDETWDETYDSSSSLIVN